MADRSEIGGMGMGKGTGACGLVGKKALCEKSGNETAENVAGATLCHAGISGRNEGLVPIWGTYERPGALEDDDAAGALNQFGEGSCAISIDVFGGCSEQFCGLAGVRRQDAVGGKRSPEGREGI